MKSIARFMHLALLASLSMSQPSWAATTPAGTVALIKGEVFIQDTNAKIVGDVSGANGRRKLAAGAPFYVGETVVTKDGRVKLAFKEGASSSSSGNEVVLGTNTSLLIERASTDPLKQKGTTLSLARGEVRSTVNQKYSGQGSDVFEVKTPNAVAGVRGTIFVARFNPTTFKSEVATERGLVAVSSLSKNGSSSAVRSSPVLVEPGKFTSTAGSAPSAPAPLSSNKELEGAVKSLAGNGSGNNANGGSGNASAGTGNGAAAGGAASPGAASSNSSSSSSASTSGSSSSGASSSTGGGSGVVSASSSGSAPAATSSSSGGGDSSAPLGREPVVSAATTGDSSGRSPASVDMSNVAPPSSTNAAAAPTTSAAASTVAQIVQTTIANVQATQTQTQQTVNQQTQQAPRHTANVNLKIQ